MFNLIVHTVVSSLVYFFENRKCWIRYNNLKVIDSSVHSYDLFLPYISEKKDLLSVGEKSCEG